MSRVIPVNAWISEGTATPGLTSVDHCERTSKPSTSSTPISVMRSLAGRVPVVSRSTMASGAWSRLCMDVCPVCYVMSHAGSIQAIVVVQGMMKEFCLAVLLLLIGGCASVEWAKPGATAEERATDTRQCQQDAW